MKSYTIIIQAAAWLAVLALALVILNWLWTPLIWLLAGVGVCSTFHLLWGAFSKSANSEGGVK